MDPESRQILLMLTWLFAQSGRADKALVLAAALYREQPADSVVAGLYARLLLGDARPDEALSVIKATRFPDDQRRLQALLTARALANLGRQQEGLAVWRAYLAGKKGVTTSP